MVEDIVNAVDYLQGHPAEVKTYKENARSAAVCRYSRKLNAGLVRAVLERILDDTRPVEIRHIEAFGISNPS